MIGAIMKLEKTDHSILSNLHTVEKTMKIIDRF